MSEKERSDGNLATIVKQNMENAVFENKYAIQSMTAQEWAEDMQACCSDVEDVDVADLLPHIVAFIEKNQNQLLTPI